MEEIKVEGEKLELPVQQPAVWVYPQLGIKITRSKPEYTLYTKLIYRYGEIVFNGEAWLTKKVTFEVYQQKENGEWEKLGEEEVSKSERITLSREEYMLKELKERLEYYDQEEETAMLRYFSNLSKLSTLLGLKPKIQVREYDC